MLCINTTYIHTYMCSYTCINVRWAIGILMYEMLCGSPPFQAEAQKDLDRKIMQEKLKLPSHTTSTAHSLLKGLLEKDMSKRLGAMKSTMFAIGGVAALKTHDFFKGIDFHMLVKKEIRPPIDITDGTIAIDGTHTIGTGNFHEDFTGQQVSQSMIDDALSAGTSQQSSQQTSPASRSRADSFEFYENFEYVDSSFTCSEEKMAEFEVEIASKLIKLQKKQKHKEKLEMERSVKQKEFEAAEKLRKEIEEKRLEEERTVKELKMAAERERQRIQDEITEYRNLQSFRKEHWAVIEKQREEYRVELDKIQKKLKNLRKKYRDIIDLEKKKECGGDEFKLSTEQVEKLNKKAEVTTEIEILEKAEKDHLGKPDVSPDIDMTIPMPDNDIEGVIRAKYKPGKGSNGNDSAFSSVCMDGSPSTPSISSTWKDVSSPEAIIRNQNINQSKAVDTVDTPSPTTCTSEGSSSVSSSKVLSPENKASSSSSSSSWRDVSTPDVMSRNQNTTKSGVSSSSSGTVWGRGNIGVSTMVTGPVATNGGTADKEKASVPAASVEVDEWQVVPAKKKTPKKW